MKTTLKTKIEWPKRKWMRQRGKTTFHVKNRQRPPTKTYRSVLEQAGIPLNHCQSCETSYIRTVIHHIDGNPYNNHRYNLQVLCRKCHRERHTSLPDEEGVYDWTWGTKTYE